MITIFLMNFGYPLEEKYWNLQDAVAKAKSVGFECAFMRDGVTIAAWHPISGMYSWRHFDEDDLADKCTSIPSCSRRA